MAEAPQPGRSRPSRKGSPATLLLDLALALPVALVLLLLGRGLGAPRDDPSLLLARLRAAETSGSPRLTGLVPGPGEVAGLVSRDDLRAWDAEGLYELIDGAAEAFLSRGCTGAASATLGFADATTVLVEVFDLERPGSAEELWRSEQAAAAEPLAIGAAAYTDGAALRFHRGSLYVRLSAYPLGGEARGHLEAVAQALDGRIR